MPDETDRGERPNALTWEEQLMRWLSISREEYRDLAAVAEPLGITVLELADTASNWQNRNRPIQEVAAELGAAEAKRRAKIEARNAYLRQRRENGEERRAHRAAATHRRPKQESGRRERSITIRVSNEEYEKLTRKAQRLQISLSAYLVESGLGRRIRSSGSPLQRDTPEVEHMEAGPPSSEPLHGSSKVRGDRGAPGEHRPYLPPSQVYWREGPAEPTTPDERVERDALPALEASPEQHGQEAPETPAGPAELPDPGTQLDLGLGDPRTEGRKRKRK